MPSKTQFYAQLAAETARGLTDSLQTWTAFLETSARLYKYPYYEQLLIFAQKPEATACAGYEVWNEAMNRYIRRGTKGIALIDSSGDTPRMKYVFDVSDTGGGANARFPLGIPPRAPGQCDRRPGTAIRSVRQRQPRFSAGSHRRRVDRELLGGTPAGHPWHR